MDNSQRMGKGTIDNCKRQKTKVQGADTAWALKLLRFVAVQSPFKVRGQAVTNKRGRTCKIATIFSATIITLATTQGLENFSVQTLSAQKVDV